MTAAGRFRLPGRLRRLPVWRSLVVLVVAALVVVGVLAGLRRGPASPSTPQSAANDNRTLLGVLENVDPQVVQAVGGGGLARVAVPVTNAPALLGAAKRPQVVFMATEGCGACAAQRWSMVIALSRFGTLKDLRLAASSSTEETGPLATFSFRSLQYTSRYLDLVAVETQDAAGRALATLSPDDQRIVATYDAPPYVPETSRGAVPWLDVANRYVMAGSGYPAQLLAGLNWAQIAERLSDARDPVTRAVVGNANWITAAICRTTGMSPDTVCNAPAVRDLATQLG